ncbi:fibronectin type III domain-containing protein [Treponema sp. Marseille-Q4130]|nr:fibronectin type III domain-containing protein [Treponema sp. Marseille-Q4130]
MANGTAISGGSFTVSDNGTYTVAVVDNDGRREIKTITVSNIDKTPPSKVKNLSAAYASGSGKITVTWTNPADADFAGCVLRWKKGAGSETEVPIAKPDTSYEMTGILSDGSVYEISVAAKDAVGNESEELTATVTASVRPSLSTVSLSRTHLAYNDTDRTITAVLTGSNFGLIGSQSDPTVKAGVFDGTTLIGGLQNAAVDAAHNKATVTLTAPALSGSQATAEGKTYTVKVKLCGSYESVTEAFVVSNEARLTANPELSVTQIASSAVTPSTKTKITIQGVNLDIAGGIKVRLYDSTGAAYGSAVPIDTTHTGSTLTTLTADIPVPSDEDFFTAKVFFGETVQTSHDGSVWGLWNPVIRVYGSPKFTSFRIPNAGTSKEDSLLTATVKGVNFTAPGISASSFSVSCATSSITNGAVFTVINDRTLKVSLTIPGAAGSYTVTVSSGSASKTGTFTVKDYSLWTPGKIVLADNTAVDKDGFTAVDPGNPPVAVVCGKNVYGAAIGVALHKGGPLRWAKSGTTGYGTYFRGIVCTPSVYNQSGAAAMTAFTGDEDGSDNWDYICSADPEGTANAAVNYPAFDWVLKYNTAYEAQLGSARPAWYMPSIAELCQVYKNKEAVNESLLKISGSASSYADASLGTGWYWSSSQYSYSDKDAWLADFGSGYLSGYYSKYGNNDVWCIAGF